MQEKCYIEKALVVDPKRKINLIDEILGLFKEAKRSLWIMSPCIDYQFYRLIVDKASIGLDVRVITRPRTRIKGKRLRKIVKALSESRKVQHKSSRLTHARIAIIDGEKAVISTGDFSRDGLKGQFNVCLVTDDKHLITLLRDLFLSAWR